MGKLFLHKHCFEEQRRAPKTCIIPRLISFSILGFIIDGQKERKMPLMNV
jgi:hypothetical protein